METGEGKREGGIIELKLLLERPRNYAGYASPQLITAKVYTSDISVLRTPPHFLLPKPDKMAALTKLNFITGNKNKLAEVRSILGNVIELDNQAVDVPEIQGTVEDIAKDKCRRAAEAVRSLCPG